MMTIDELCDRAKAQIGTKSDREPSRRLGLKDQVINSYRTKRSWPSDSVMLQLEELTAQARTAQRAVEHRHAITDARRRAQQMRRALETDPAVEAKHRRVMELWRRGPNQI